MERVAVHKLANPPSPWKRYLATVTDGLDHPLPLESLQASAIDDGLLPDFDFVLPDRPTNESTRYFGIRRTLSRLSKPRGKAVDT